MNVDFIAALAQIELPPGVSLEFKSKVTWNQFDNNGQGFDGDAQHDKIILKCSAAALAACGTGATVATATVVPSSMVMAQPVALPPAEKSLVEQIQDLAQMKNDGLLSEDEFTAAKAKLMASS